MGAKLGDGEISVRGSGTKSCDGVMCRTDDFGKFRARKVVAKMGPKKRIVAK